MRYIGGQSDITWTAEQTRDLPTTGSSIRRGPSPPRARMTSPRRIWNQDDAEYGQVRTKAERGRWYITAYSGVALKCLSLHVLGLSHSIFDELLWQTVVEDTGGRGTKSG